MMTRELVEARLAGSSEFASSLRDAQTVGAGGSPELVCQVRWASGGGHSPSGQRAPRTQC